LARSFKGQTNEETENKHVQIKCSTNLVLGQQSAREQFVQSIKTCFDGEVKKCDFRQKPEQCREQIEQWITAKLGVKAPGVLSRTAVTGNTKILSVGTIQVKTNWGKQFRKNLKTSQGRFFALGEQRASTVKMMQTEGTFNYYEDEQMQVLGVPTEEKQLTVYFLLPKDRHGLNQMDKHRIQFGKQLEQILIQCDSNKRNVNVQLPQFQIVHKSEEAKRVLRKLGVEDAFDGDQADFSAISETPKEHLLKHGRRQTGGLEDIDVQRAKDQYQRQQQGQLHLNKMIQLVTVQVDENGLNSAIGQHAHMGKAKLHRNTDQDDDDDDDKDNADSDSDDRDTDRNRFKVDHAFAFIVKHNPTKQMLMIGRVVDVLQKPINDGNNRDETD
jgi:serine protease inhibitor